MTETKSTVPEKKSAGVVVLSIIAILLVIGILLIVGKQIYIANEYRTYKLDYPEQIEKYSIEYDLDPYLVAAVIDVESNNRADVQSGVGARGLMQIMPETGKWIAEKLGQPYSQEMLDQPDMNIRFGCWYLRFLSDRFAQRNTVLAAYNAGHGRVSGWLGDENISADGQLLDAIPYPETDQYVVKVLKSYERYKKLYPDAFLR